MSERRFDVSTIGVAFVNRHVRDVKNGVIDLFFSSSHHLFFLSLVLLVRLEASQDEQVHLTPFFCLLSLMWEVWMDGCECVFGE